MDKKVNIVGARNAKISCSFDGFKYLLDPDWPLSLGSMNVLQGVSVF